MSELVQSLIGDSYAAPPSHILEALTEEQVHSRIPGVSHTLYEELWHMTFWQQVSLGWISNVEIPFPGTPNNGFPTPAEIAAEPWLRLHQRFFETLGAAGEVADLSPAVLDRLVNCPSRPGQPTRVMSIRDQLISLAAHNAYHLGRIVLLRQLMGSWPPPSGGFAW